MSDTEPKDAANAGMSIQTEGRPLVGWLSICRRFIVALFLNWQVSRGQYENYDRLHNVRLQKTSVKQLYAMYESFICLCTLFNDDEKFKIF